MIMRRNSRWVASLLVTSIAWIAAWANPAAASAETAALSVVINASEDRIFVGQTVHYSIKATNDGPATATSALLVVELPSHLGFDGAAGCSNVAGRIECPLGSIPAGDAALIEVPATGLEPGTGSVRASVSAEQDDPDPGDNVAVRTTVVAAADTVPPVAPIIVGTDPQSPANDNTPVVLGTAEPGATVRVWTPVCGDTLVGSVTASDPAGSFAVRAVVADDSDTAFVADATDEAGNVSACSSAFVYAERSSLPVLSVADAVAHEGHAGSVPMTFTASLSFPAVSAVELWYRTEDGDAIAPDDYEPAAGRVVLLRGQQTAVITVMVRGDLFDEGSGERFFVRLTDVSGATAATSRAVGAIVDDDPVSVVEAMRALAKAGTSPVDAVQAIEAVFTLTGAELSAIFEDAAYAPGDLLRAMLRVSEQFTPAALLASARSSVSGVDAAAAIRDVLRLTPAEIARMLLDAGYSPLEIGRALKDALNQGATEAARVLREIGVLPSDIVAMLASVFEIDIAAIAGIFADLGYTAAQAGDALRAGLAATPEAVVSALRAAWYDVVEVAAWVKAKIVATPSAVVSLLRRAGYGAVEAARAIKSVLLEGAEVAAALLSEAGYAIVDVAAALKQIYGKTKNAAAAILAGVGATALEIAAAMHQVYVQTAAETAKILKGAGFSAEQIALALRTIFAFDLSAAAALMKSLGYSLVDLWWALAATFGASPAELAELMMELQFDLQDIMEQMHRQQVPPAEAANVAKGAGYSATDIANALKDAYDLSAHAIVSVLSSVLVEIQDIGAALKVAYGLTASQTAAILKDAGATVEQIALVLTEVYKQGAQAVASVLRGLGFSFQQIATVLKGVLGRTAAETAKIVRDLGATAFDVAGILKAVYRLSASAAASILREVAFDAVTTGEAVYRTFTLTLRQLVRISGCSHDIAMRVMRNVGTAAPDAADAMRDEACSANQVASGLRAVYSLGQQSAARILRDAGFGVIQIAEALKAKFGADAASAAETLRAIGYGATQITRVLDQVYDRSALQAARILKSVRFGIVAIGEAIRDVMDVKAEVMWDIFERLGYSFEEISAAICDLFGC